MVFGIGCNQSDTVLCGKIIKATQNVGKLISSVILFNEPLFVRVIIRDNCVFGVDVDCTEDEAKFIGNFSRILIRGTL